jgi:Signal peptidase (SPase) II
MCATLAVDPQTGGAVGNAIDRVILESATDVLFARGGPVWNFADVALLIGTVLATWSLARRTASLLLSWRRDLELARTRTVIAHTCDSVSVRSAAIHRTCELGGKSWRTCGVSCGRRDLHIGPEQGRRRVTSVLRVDTRPSTRKLARLAVGAASRHSFESERPWSRQLVVAVRLLSASTRRGGLCW